MFRFTIRDVLWLTTLVALALVWWQDRSYLARECKRLDENWGATVEIANSYQRQISNLERQLKEARPPVDSDAFVRSLLEVDKALSARQSN